MMMMLFLLLLRRRRMMMMMLLLLLLRVLPKVTHWSWWTLLMLRLCGCFVHLSMS